jgi:hypothetical protein
MLYRVPPPISGHRTRRTTNASAPASQFAAGRARDADGIHIQALSRTRCRSTPGCDRPSPDIRGEGLGADDQLRTSTRGLPPHGTVRVQGRLPSRHGSFLSPATVTISSARTPKPCFLLIKRAHTDRSRPTCPASPVLQRRCPNRGALTRLLDGSVRTGVRPDSVQALGGTLSMRLPTPVAGVALYRIASPSSAVSRCGSRGDCPARSSNARLAVLIGPRQTVSVAWRKCSSGSIPTSCR